MDQTEWDGAWSAVVGKQVRSLREHANLSAQQLADMCARIGRPVPRPTIAALERGDRRTVPVQELVVIARALDVPPVRLLYPITEGSTSVEVLPGVEVLPIEAMEWFVGSDNGPFTGQRLQEVEWPRREVEQQSRALHFARRVEETERGVLDVQAGVVNLGDSEEERAFFEEQGREALRIARYGLGRALGELGQARRQLVSLGMTPPPLNEKIAAAYKKRMVELGHSEEV